MVLKPDDGRSQFKNFEISLKKIDFWNYSRYWGLLVYVIANEHILRTFYMTSNEEIFVNYSGYSK